MKKFSMEDLKQRNIVIKMVSGIGVIYFHKVEEGWKHDRFGYIMIDELLLEYMNNENCEAEIMKIDPYGMNDML